jgi:hypothetical protein
MWKYSVSVQGIRQPSIPRTATGVTRIAIYLTASGYIVVFYLHRMDFIKFYLFSGFMQLLLASQVSSKNKKLPLFIIT